MAAATVEHRTAARSEGDCGMTAWFEKYSAADENAGFSTIAYISRFFGLLRSVRQTLCQAAPALETPLSALENSCFVGR
jgi:hypothetical protein